MVERLLDMAQDLPLGAYTWSDKDKEYAERFYGYICAVADKSRALGYYAYRADSGDFVAHYIAGLCYFLARDFTNARKCLESICAKSDSQSTFRHIDGSEFKIDAKDLQKIKARCYNYLGLMYSEGHLERDYQKSFELQMQAGDLGYCDGYGCVADMHRYGQGVAKDYNKAVEYYNKAGNMGAGWAYNSLGYMYQHGEGVNQNYQKAVELYQKGADLGDASAFNNLGYMYDEGRGVNQNYKKAIELYQKACDLGVDSAFNSLGLMYGSGKGVNQDYQKAVELYQKGADLGNAWAFNNLGIMYKCGQGVNVDKQKALQLFKKACNMGNEKGCKNYRNLRDELGV